MTFPWHELVGRYHLEVTDELRTFIERAFVEKAGEAEQDAVREDALAEARGAEIELTADGVLISRSRGIEFLRVSVAAREDSVSELHFEKAPGVPVRIEIVDRSTLIAEQKGRPRTSFRRTTDAPSRGDA